MRLSLMIGGALLAATALAQAQAPDANKPPRRFDCSQAKDPKACEERFAKRKAAFTSAGKACEASKGKSAEHRDCMRRELCAQTQDPAQCEARAREAMAKREKIRAACKEKKGEEYRACIRAERGKT